MDLEEIKRKQEMESIKQTQKLHVLWQQIGPLLPHGGQRWLQEPKMENEGRIICDAGAVRQLST